MRTITARFCSIDLTMTIFMSVVVLLAGTAFALPWIGVDDLSGAPQNMMQTK